MIGNNCRTTDHIKSYLRKTICNWSACMKREIEIEEANVVCKDRDIRCLILSENHYVDNIFGTRKFDKKWTPIMTGKFINHVFQIYEANIDTEGIEETSRAVYYTTNIALILFIFQCHTFSNGTRVRPGAVCFCNFWLRLNTLTFSHKCI